MDAIVVESSFHSTYAVVSVDSIYSVYLTWNTYDTLYFRAFLLWRENIIIVRLQVVVEKYFVRHPYSYWITVQYSTVVKVSMPNRILTVQTYRLPPGCHYLKHVQTQPGHSGPISSVPCRHFSFKLVQYIKNESSESRRSSFSLDGRDRMECPSPRNRTDRALKRYYTEDDIFPVQEVCTVLSPKETSSFNSALLFHASTY